MNQPARYDTVRPQARQGLKRRLKALVTRVSPTMAFLIQYARSTPKIRSKVARNVLFDEFLRGTSGPCLQIAIKDSYGRKYGENWVAVDKYDHGPQIDRHDDVQALGFPDESFNAVVCWSVLEHVPDPQQAIREMHRILKPGGSIWVQLPFLFPYHADPHDYWRVTPSGLRAWMRDFEEKSCGCDYWAGTSIVAATFFWGTKRKP